MPEGTQAGAAREVPLATGATAFPDEHRRILEAIASGVPTPEALQLIVRLVERAAPGIRASILVREGDRLLHGAAPSLPDAYNRAIHGLVIGPGVGSCGTAAHTGKPVVVQDVATHPFWAAFRALAATHELRACWSTPVLGRGGEVIGTFALYPHERRGPTPQEERLVAEATHLASIAIQHDQLLRQQARLLAEEGRRAHLRDFLKGAPMPVALVKGPDLVFEFANGAYEALVNRRGIEGKRVIDVFPEIQDQGILELMRAIRASGEPYENPEMRVEIDRGRGREEGWFAVRIQPYDEPDGEERSLLVVGLEVTAQVKARQDLDLRRAELATREKTSALGQLVSGVAHEIRTPLTYLATNLNIIQLRLEKLVRSLPPTEAEAAHMLVDQYIPSALEGVDRINHIVEDLREFTQLRHGARERADLGEVVGQAVSLFQATHRGRVSVRYDPGESALVELDKLQVQQAVLNLLQNALEAEPRDHTILVRTSREAGMAAVEVADTGPGIPRDVQTRMFDPFYTTKAGGTGLGLSIVKRVVDDHHGTIAVDTGPAGTTFRLALPLPGA